jgi:hypothetical protein
VLPKGTPAEVQDEVRLHIKHLAPSGGYVLASVHNIRAEVPPENVIAMFEAAKRYGKHPLSGLRQRTLGKAAPTRREGDRLTGRCSAIPGCKKRDSARWWCISLNGL